MSVFGNTQLPTDIQDIRLGVGAMFQCNRRVVVSSRCGRHSIGEQMPRNTRFRTNLGARKRTFGTFFGRNVSSASPEVSAEVTIYVVRGHRKSDGGTEMKKRSEEVTGVLTAPTRRSRDAVSDATREPSSTSLEKPNYSTNWGQDGSVDQISE